MIRRKKRYFRKKRISILKRRWFYDFVLVSIFLGSLSYLLFKTPYFEIKDVKISGQDTMIIEGVKNFFTEGSNFFILRSKDITKTIKENFPKIKELRIRKELPNKILVDIMERKTFGIFCPRLDLMENPPCFLISEDGVIFSNFDNNDSPEEIPALIINEIGKKPKLGEQVIKDKLMKDIVFLQKELEKNELFSEEIEITPLGIKVKVKQIKTDNPIGKEFLIYFSQDTAIETQIEVLLDAFREKISAEEKKNLEYIDLRGLKEGKKSEIYWK